MLMMKNFALYLCRATMTINLGEDCYSGIHFWLGLNYYHRNCFLAQAFDLFCINRLQEVYLMTIK